MYEFKINLIKTNQEVKVFNNYLIDFYNIL